MRLILDRFEGNFAVLTDENCRVYDVERSRLPEDSQENDAFEADILHGNVVSVERIISTEHAGENAARLRELFKKHAK